jgi:spermidine/putrescine ABC transporter ATP-binding subunit
MGEASMANAAHGLSSSEYAVEIIGASKSFGEIAAVKSVTLPIRNGELLTLLGPSGCGKTTLLNMIAGFEELTSGHIRIAGRDVTGMPPHERNTGMVFQNYALFPHMNVFDNIAFGLRMRGTDRRTLADEVGRVLEMVKLPGMEKRRVRQLSGGQQQRIALARAIVFRPKVLLLDEPLSALDKHLRARMQVELKDLHRETGLTTIFVTHDQGEALSLSDRVAVMSRGEIQQVSTPLELYHHPANGFVASFIGEINRLSPVSWRVEGGSVIFEFPRGAQLVGAKQLVQDVSHGENVHLFLRPEHIAPLGNLAPAGDSSRSTATVAAHIYQGSHTLTRVKAEGLGLLELRVTGGEIIEAFPVGAEIEITLDLASAVVLSSREAQ